jgi:hypothetical protein
VQKIMKPSTQRLAQRRSDDHQTGTFTFWFRRPHAAKAVGAWMLDQSNEEAAFLTTAGDAPRVGEQLELTAACESGFRSTEYPHGPGSRLPRFGRVVRLDDPQGVTQRVAIRFEAQPWPPQAEASESLPARAGQVIASARAQWPSI